MNEYMILKSTNSIVYFFLFGFHLLDIKHFTERKILS